MVTYDRTAPASIARRHAEDVQAYIRTARHALDDAAREAEFLREHHDRIADRTEPATCTGWALDDDGTITITADDGHQTRIPPGTVQEIAEAHAMNAGLALVLPSVVIPSAVLDVKDSERSDEDGRPQDVEHLIETLGEAVETVLIGDEDTRSEALTAAAARALLALDELDRVAILAALDQRDSEEADRA